jgi:hypothetical protein
MNLIVPRTALLKVIVLPPQASITACRSEPAPESRTLTTTGFVVQTVAAFADDPKEKRFSHYPDSARAV